MRDKLLEMAAKECGQLAIFAAAAERGESAVADPPIELVEIEDIAGSPATTRAFEACQSGSTPGPAAIKMIACRTPIRIEEESTSVCIKHGVTASDAPR